jgi:hypothetical protein
MFDEIGLLVLEGDAAGLAAKVSELSASRPAGGRPAAVPAQLSEGGTAAPGVRSLP